MKRVNILLLIILTMLITGCNNKKIEEKNSKEYSLDSVQKVNGRQGVAYNNSDLYVTADDGDADKEEPDNMYRIAIKNNIGKVTPEKTFNDVIKQGEIEGLNFDKNSDKFLLLYNRGARIVLGMPKGFYDGYTEEIHEVFIYNINDNK